MAAALNIEIYEVGGHDNAAEPADRADSKAAAHRQFRSAAGLRMVGVNDRGSKG